MVRFLAICAPWTLVAAAESCAVGKDILPQATIDKFRRFRILRKKFYQEKKKYALRSVAKTKNRVKKKQSQSQSLQTDAGDNEEDDWGDMENSEDVDGAKQSIGVSTAPRRRRRVFATKAGANDVEAESAKRKRRKQRAANIKREMEDYISRDIPRSGITTKEINEPGWIRVDEDRMNLLEDILRFYSQTATASPLDYQVTEDGAYTQGMNVWATAAVLLAAPVDNDICPSYIFGAWWASAKRTFTPARLTRSGAVPLFSPLSGDMAVQALRIFFYMMRGMDNMVIFGSADSVVIGTALRSLGTPYAPNDLSKKLETNMISVDVFWAHTSLYTWKGFQSWKFGPGCYQAFWWKILCENSLTPVISAYVYALAELFKLPSSEMVMVPVLGKTISNLHMITTILTTVPDKIVKQQLTAA